LGSVSVVNTLGSGVLENPGLFPFFPRLAERLLGESLELPMVPTWWCGDPAGRSHVLAHLKELVIKPVDRGGGPGPAAIFGWLQSADQIDQLRRRIEATPHRWVGQAELALASAPTLGDNALEARRGALRAFAVVRGDSYMAMPGGLTRVAGGPGSIISNQTGAVSKDTWVLASEPEQMAGYWLSTGPAVVAVEPEASVSSRAAENLVWLGRYAERAENVVRLLRVVHDRRNDFADGANPAGVACVRALLAALTQVTDTQPGFVGEGAPALLASPGEELQSLAVDADRPGTLAFDVQRLLDAAYAARDQLSVDTWLVVSSLHRDLLDIPSLGRVTLRRVLASLLALAGLGAESMVRDPGWRFMDAGRRIERGAQLSALLRATVTVDRDEATDSLLLESVLMAAESIITYRRRYRSHAQVETLLDLMLLDAGNPRSLMYQVDRLLEDLRDLPGHPGAGRVSEAEKPALQAFTALRVADTARLSVVDADGSRSQLDSFLANVSDWLQKAFDELAVAHFSHLLPQRALLTPADPRAARGSHPFGPVPS
jgi:uncharacterized alpha-E superfamily protein